ncbi:MAG: membrane protein insertase YidC [Candidatus Binatia bacterium]
MERRALIAVVISVLILVLYQEVVIKRLYPHTDPPPSTGPPAVAPPTDQAVEAAPAVPPVAGAPVAAAAAPAPADASDVMVDTNYYRAVFTTAGARLKSFELKHYRSTVAADSPPLQMVAYPVSGRLPLALALRGQEAIDDAGVLYRADQTQLTVDESATATVTFVGELAGATLQKRIQVRGDGYLWGIDVQVDNMPAAYTEIGLSWDEGINPAGPKAAEVVFNQVVLLQDDKLVHELFTDLAPGRLSENNISWFGFSGAYFLAALVPESEPPNALRLWTKRTENLVEAQLLHPPGSFATHADLYVGPKDINRLEAVGHGLRRAVDLGWFTFVALPMLQALRFLHSFTGNYGIAIILLTVLIKLAFYPLTKKSFQSMRDMQKLQPEMQKIRERLADKPEEVNREVMELYKRHKVNPLGGCLPMLLQLPVFVGLYNALQNAVELRHAPFFGWVTDLSAPDRLGSLQLPFVEHPGIPVLTLIMGASMFVQQWMTPSAADPAQQRVMMIMPVMFTFMFINFPAGLTLYWLVNNCLTIAQQYAMMRPAKR